MWTELNPDRCIDSVLRIKTAPKQISDESSELFVDEDFKGRYQSLFWPGYGSHDNFWNINLDFFLGNIGWSRLSTMYPNAQLFGNEDEKMVSDPIQSTIGNCWILASMAAVAVKPDRIKSLFVVDPLSNEKGAYTITLYIRGKPWLVQIDDMILQNLNEGNTLDDR